MTASTCGSEFFNTWRVTAHSESPLARRVCTKSWLRTSATAARVVRDRMPTGIIASVTTGNTRNRALLHSKMWKPVEPPAGEASRHDPHPVPDAERDRHREQRQ